MDQALATLQRRGCVAYRTLKRQFTLDEVALEDLKAEFIDAQRLAADEDGNVLVWTGSAASPPTPAPAPERAPRPYMPPYLAEKILTSRGALEGKRKQVTVLFADRKGSMELLADRDPEEAWQLLEALALAEALRMRPLQAHCHHGCLLDTLALFPKPALNPDEIRRRQDNRWGLGIVEVEVIAGSVVAAR